MRGALMALALSSTVVFAQPDQRGHGGKKGMKAEAQKALKSYVETNVLPVVSPMRTAFDQNLTGAEQQELTEIRQGLADMKAARKAQRDEMRKSHTPGQRPEMTEEQAAAKRENAKIQRQLMTRAWAIADAHETELNTVFETLRPQMNTWREEMHTLMQDFRPEDAPQRERQSDMKAGKGRKGGHARKGGMHRRSMLGAIHTPVGFLLWESGSELMGSEREAASIQVFPNPVADSFTLRFQSSKPGTVRIQLISDMGEPIKTLYSGKALEGEQELKLDLSDIESGTYLIQVQGPDGPQSTKLVKE